MSRPDHLEPARRPMFLLWLVLAGAPALAQQTERESASWRERLLFGGEVSAAFSKHDIGYFNQLDYASSTLRLLRASLLLELRASERFSLLAEVQSFNFDRVAVYSLYARVRPFEDRSLWIRFGRVPPVFGAFPQRIYDDANPLIGYPLAYQYPTSVRADAGPASLDELRTMRGRGAKTTYRLGSPELAVGLPFVNPLRRDVGVSVSLGSEPLALDAAVTQGTPSNPRLDDDNPGKGLVARLRFKPSAALVLGASAARGRYDSQELTGELGRDRAEDGAHQTLFGADVEYAAGHWILRGEAIWNRFRSPTLGLALDGTAGFVEARFKVMPGLYLAGRAERMSFGEVGDEGGFAWEAPVSRLELGLGYRWHRQLLTKLALQHNRRDGGRVSVDTFVAVQAVVWF